MSRTAITLKFKLACFLDEACPWADINLPPLMPDKDNNFGGSLGLDFKRKWWRHVQPKNTTRKKILANIWYPITAQDLVHTFSLQSWRQR